MLRLTASSALRVFTWRDAVMRSRSMTPCAFWRVRCAGVMTYWYAMLRRAVNWYGRLAVDAGGHHRDHSQR